MTLTPQEIARMVRIEASMGVLPVDPDDVHVGPPGRFVYCLFDGFYSDRYLFGVFSSLEAAQAAAKHEGHEPDWQEPSYSYVTERRWDCEGKSGPRIFGCGFGIEERVLDQP